MQVKKPKPRLLSSWVPIWVSENCICLDLRFSICYHGKPVVPKPQDHLHVVQRGAALSQGWENWPIGRIWVERFSWGKPGWVGSMQRYSRCQPPWLRARQADSCDGFCEEGQTTLPWGRASRLQRSRSPVLGPKTGLVLRVYSRRLGISDIGWRSRFGRGGLGL